MSVKVFQGRLIPVTLLAIVALHVVTVVAGELTHEQLVSEVVGNTIQYQNGSETIFEFIAPDGVIHGNSTVHGRYLARWRFFGDASICFEHDDPMASGCVAVALREGLIEYHRRDGVVEGPFTLLEGNPERL